ncbi:MAG: hypothetical protein M3552_01110 [Planctomycetota bacterium]|nr:hypothetical protein [Planctomycetaceae bacterium]MDQ3329245.1 hypothetical protein [Planctomycetota bacterium]
MSNTVGAISSLLMSLPLIAVPCLAVFGLPSIGPATAEAETDDAIELGAPAELGASSTKAPASASGGFSPIVDAGPGTPAENPFSADAGADRSAIDRTSDHRGAVANRATGLEETGKQPSPPAAVFQERAAPIVPEDAFADVQPPKPRPKTDAGSTGASWEQIVADLNGKGITEFYLTNGEVPGEFYFTCSVAAGPNVTQRFEAEGASPAAAARVVLSEVAEWQATR